MKRVISNADQKFRYSYKRWTNFVVIPSESYYFESNHTLLDIKKVIVIQSLKLNSILLFLTSMCQNVNLFLWLVLNIIYFLELNCLTLLF